MEFVDGGVNHCSPDHASDEIPTSYSCSQPAMVANTKIAELMFRASCIILVQATIIIGGLLRWCCVRQGGSLVVEAHLISWGR